MKKQLLLSLCVGAMMPAIATAEDTSTATMIISGEGDRLGSVQVSTLSTITFDGNSMVVSDGTDSQTYALSDITEISFSMSSSDVINAKLSDSLTIELRDCILTVSSGAEAPVVMSVYTMSGQLVASHTATGSMSVDLSPLTKGIYIIRVNDKTVKFIR